MTLSCANTARPHRPGKGKKEQPGRGKRNKEIEGAGFPNFPSARAGFPRRGPSIARFDKEGLSRIPEGHFPRETKSNRYLVHALEHSPVPTLSAPKTLAPDDVRTRPTSSSACKRRGGRGGGGDRVNTTTPGCKEGEGAAAGAVKGHLQSSREGQRSRKGGRTGTKTEEGAHGRSET